MSPPLSYVRLRAFAPAALVLVLGINTAFAQVGHIEGTVRNVLTLDPVANARITVVGIGS
ncbi:MAG: hypothetical protein ACE5HT_13795 [Gemmatimonadales bacterium]